MRHALLSALFVLTLTPLGVPPPQKDVSLELGPIKVWLGMSKADVLKASAAAGYGTMEDKDANIIYLVTKGKADLRSYAVAFKAERLSFASRSWYSGGDAFDAILGVTATFDGQNCGVSNQPVNTPDVKANRVLISCGSRSVMILKGTARDEHIADVIERIGAE